jgi:signal transduction histidine kinase
MPAIVTGLTLVVYLTALGWVNLRLRAALREQIVDRAARVLNEVALLQIAPEASSLDPLSDESESFSGLSEVLVLDVGERLREITSRSATVLGARLFDEAGELILPLPLELLEYERSPESLAQLHRREPHARFLPAVRLSEMFATVGEGGEPAAPLPVLEVFIPIRAPGAPVPMGTVQLLLDGSGVAEEFRQLDATLLHRTLVLGLVGALVMAGALAWAFRRLAGANRLLRDRTTELVRANTELALAAKTSAVGAVAAHLMHGLKNPLAGLESFVSSLDGKASPADQEELREALLTTQRAQQLVQETVRILREEDSSVRYDLTADELVELLSARAAPAAKSFSVEWRVEGAADCALSNREANLILLILENLVRNAIEVTPTGRAVVLHVAAHAGGIRLAVADAGPGIPVERQPALFTPQRSSKPGGAGIGLAISRQLAAHIGARLELESSGPEGTVFALTLDRPNPAG